MKVSIVLAVLVWLTAACVPDIPTVAPQVSVAITLVQNEAALDAAVAQALTATVDTGVYATETALAEAGITLTPSPTPSHTPTPPAPTTTPVLSPTPTRTPTETIVPTSTALASNTPNPVVEAVAGQVRVIHAWQSDRSGPVDVFIDELPVAIAMTIGDATNYQGVRDASVRIRVNALINQLVSVPPGSSVSVVLADVGFGLEALVVEEDLSPLASGQARLTLLQANRDLLRVDLFDDIRDITLLRNFDVAQIGGPFDLPVGNLSLSLADSEFSDQILSRIGALRLDSHVHYLAIFAPGMEDTAFIPQMLVYETGTRLNVTDIPVRFINAAPAVGPINIDVNNIPLVTGLNVGDVTVPLPMPLQDMTIIARDQTGKWIFEQEFSGELIDSIPSERLILISDLPESQIDRDSSQPTLVGLTRIDREPRVSSALANVRLIHGLTGATNTLDLEIRASNPTRIANPIGIPAAAQSDTNWSQVIGDIGFGQASGYVSRSPNVFDVRVTLSSTGAVQSTVNDIELLPGGSYDLVVVPGPGVGVTRILVLEPNPQVTILMMRRDDPQLVADRVAATLTAVAPAVTQTVAQARTATATISPVPTNTPQPSSTPRAKSLALQVNPAPPNAVTDAFILIGESFTPNSRYVVSVDNGAEILSGRVSDSGTISLRVDVPPDLAPGAHVVRVCAGCRSEGVQEEVYAVFVVLNPGALPTATPEL